MNLLSISSFLNEAHLTLNNYMLHKYRKPKFKTIYATLKDEFITILLYYN